MVWRREQGYSQDLRARVLAEVDDDMAEFQAPPLFQLSISYIDNALTRRRRTGDAGPSRDHGHRRWVAAGPPTP